MTLPSDIASNGAARLAALLTEKPVDLARVSDEIRSRPALARLVKRIAALQLSIDESVSSVEEAAVMLGTDRLQVVLHAWLQLEKNSPRQIQLGRVSDGAKRFK